MKPGWLIEMSRNICDYNKKLFDMIRSKGDQIIDDGKRRYINITDTTNRDFFLHAKLLSSIKPIIGYDFALFSYSSEYYFVLIGSETPVFFNDDLITVNLDEGIFLAIISDLKITLLKDISETKIQDFYNYYDDPYSGHDFDDLKKFFLPICVYKITLSNNTNFDIALNKLAIDFFASNSDTTILPLSSDCRDYFLLLTYTTGDIIPIGNVLRSVNASTWVYCFLDLYRCIENLYDLGKIYKHYDSFKDQYCFSDFYGKLGNTLNHKANEIEALTVLVSLIDNHITPLLNHVLVGNEKEETFIYRVRNNIVHHRNDTENVDFDNEEWNKIIIFLLSSINFLYEKFEDVVA